MPPCKDGANFHVFVIGGSRCSCCGWDRYAQMSRLQVALDPSTKRIRWADYTDDEMEKLALYADRHGNVRLLRRIQKATLRRESR